MTIASEITRIKGNIVAAYNAASNKGATLPVTQDSDNLADCIDSIVSGGGDTITATNSTGSAISNGDKVWIKPQGSNYNLISPLSLNDYNNFITNGTISVNPQTGNVTGFSVNNYLQLPIAFNPRNNPWEVRVKFSSEDVSQSPAIFHSMLTKFGGIYGILFDIDNGKFELGISDTGSSWLFTQTGTYTPQSNTVYWVKFGWTGTEYYLEYSTDGETYTRDITYTSTIPVTSVVTATVFGLFSWTSGQGRYLNGTLYLSNCSIYINDAIWWQPREISHEVLMNVVGSPTISETGAVTGFSSSNYIQQSSVYVENFTTESHTVYFKFKVSSRPNSQAYVLSARPFANFNIIINTNQICFWNNGSQQMQSLVNYELNKDYWIKIVVNGTSRAASYSTDGITYSGSTTWTENGTMADTFGLEVGTNTTDHQPLSGTVYLGDFYIEDVNNNVVWKATKELVKVPDDCLSGFATENIAANASGSIKTVLS